LPAQQIVTSSGALPCLLWALAPPTPVAEFKDHAADVMSVSLNPIDKNTFVSGACDATAKLWDLRDGKCKQTFFGH